MTIERRMHEDPRILQALQELQGIIQARYPDATFEVSRGIDDPDSVHLLTTVDVEDLDEVADLVIERELDLHINEGLPVHVIPIRPLTRVLEEIRGREDARAAHSRPAAL